MKEVQTFACLKILLEHLTRYCSFAFLPVISDIIIWQGRWFLVY